MPFVLYHSAFWSILWTKMCLPKFYRLKSRHQRDHIYVGKTFNKVIKVKGEHKERVLIS